MIFTSLDESTSMGQFIILYEALDASLQMAPLEFATKKSLIDFVSPKFNNRIHSSMRNELLESGCLVWQELVPLRHQSSSQKGAKSLILTGVER